MFKLDQRDDYINFINELKQKIQLAQQKAILSANKELVLLYWEIGRGILQKQKEQGWGAKIIDSLSHDLISSFPEMKDFSPRNLKYMRKFAETYPESQIVQALLAQLTWYHNLALLEKLDLIEERLWYAKKAIESGWSRNVLVHQIESRLFQRQALSQKTTNFAQTLPEEQSELVIETLKDPYLFDFLSSDQKMRERDIENQLVIHSNSITQ